MNGIIGVYNNTIGRLPGVSKIDMKEFSGIVVTHCRCGKAGHAEGAADMVTSRLTVTWGMLTEQTVANDKMELRSIGDGYGR